MAPLRQDNILKLLRRRDGKRYDVNDEKYTRKLPICLWKSPRHDSAPNSEFLFPSETEAECGRHRSLKGDLMASH
jgi:hypothetical protein